MTSTPLIKPMPIRVFNSDSLAIVASVGIHALLLGLFLPSLTNQTSSEKSPDQRDVEVIELTAAEMARLPDQSPSLDMPNFPDSSLSDLPVLDSPSLNLDPPLPSNFDTLPAPPALPPLPSLPPLSSNYRPLPRPLPRPPQSLPIAPPPNLPSRLPAPPPRSSEQETSQNATPQFPPIAKRPDFGPLKPPVPIDQLINQGKGDRSNNQTERNPITPNSTEDQTALNSEQDRKDRLIRNLVRETIEGANNLRYNENNTTNEDARRNDAQWMARTGTPVTKKENWQNLTGTYPKAACLKKLEGTAIYGISVNPQGNVVKNPYLIKSAGYGILNQQALNQIKSKTFSTDGQLQHYRVRVSFNFDPTICPTVTRSPQNQETKPTTPATPEKPSQPTTENQAKPATPEVSTPATSEKPSQPTTENQAKPATPEVSTPATPEKPSQPTTENQAKPATPEVSTPATPEKPSQPTTENQAKPATPEVSTPATPEKPSQPTTENQAKPATPEVSTPATPEKPSQPTTENQAKPATPEVSTPATPEKPSQPTTENQAKPATPEVSTPATPEKLSQPTTENQAKPANSQTSSKNAPPLPPSAKKEKTVVD